MDEKVRRQFPYIKRRYKGKSLAYLDSASTTQKPQVVVDAIADVYKNHYANIHRGIYDLSQEATELYENVRVKVKKFTGAGEKYEAIFTKNTTESINLVARSLGDWVAWNDGDEILLTEMEHHSNIVPWQLLAEREKTQKISIKYIPIKKDGRLDLRNLDKLVTTKTKILSLTLMSNVLGVVNDAEIILRRVKKINPNVIVIIDAAQAVGHMRLDVAKMDADFVAFSAHKMYGPTGVGVLLGKKGLLGEMPPFMGGGDMILSVGFDKTTFNKVPWKFEAGTQNICDVIAYGAAIEYVEKIGFGKIQKHEMELTKYSLNRLKEIPEVQIYGISKNEERPRQRYREVRTSFLKRGPVIAFNIDGIHPHDVASILNEQAVAIRSGHHCAQPLMGVLGESAVCRVSFGVYNTKEEVDRLVEGIMKVKKIFGLKSKDERLKQQTKEALVISR